MHTLSPAHLTVSQLACDWNAPSRSFEAWPTWERIWVTYILHNTGRILTSHSITRLLKRFFEHNEQKLSPIRTMTLRASNASYMLQRYSNGLFAANMSDEKFIEMLSKLMNTSLEQLYAPYAATNENELVGTATNFLAVVEHTEDGHSTSQSD